MKNHKLLGSSSPKLKPVMTTPSMGVVGHRTQDYLRSAAHAILPLLGSEMITKY